MIFPGKKKYFLSILTLFTLFSLLLIVFSTAYFTNKMTKVMTGAIAEKHQRSITQLSYLFDNFHAQLIPGLKESSYNNFSLNDLMYSYELETYEIKEGLDKLDTLLMSYPLIHSIYLYNGQMNFFLTTSSGLEEAEDFYDREVLETLTNFNRDFVDYYWPRTGRFTLSPYSNLIVEKPTLTLLLGTTPSEKAHLKGALIVNLDLEEVTTLLTGGIEDSRESVCIINQKGEYITSAGNIVSDELRLVYDEVRAGGEEKGILFEKDRIISFQYNYRLGWYFFGIMPLNEINDEIRPVTNTIIAVMLILLILAFLLSYLGARRIYRPIDKLVNFVSSGDGKESFLIERENELALIQNHYRDILSEKDSLEDSLSHLNDDYRTEVFRSLLDGNEYHFWADELEPQDQALLRGSLGLFLFQVDDYYEIRMTMEPEEFRNKRRDLVKSIRGALNGGELLIDMTSRNLVCLSPEGEGALERMTALHRRLNGEDRVSLTLGCAFRKEEKAADLSRLYEAAADRAGEKFLTGYGGIHITKENSAPTSLPAKVLDRFFSVLPQGREAECDEKFDEILAFLKTSGYREYLQFINIFSYRFLIFLRDSRQSALVPLLQKARNNPQTLETLDIFTRFYRNVYRTILSERQKENQKGLNHFRQIERLMTENFRDPAFCVQSLAEQTALSPNYLRKIYRDFSETSLSDKITLLRLEEACRLLRESSDPVKELYSLAGFTNYNSFFTSFKKHTGLTPALYRQKSRSGE